jgi:Putative binding domain, N-terminal
VTAPRICSRTATSDVSWITVIGGETGAGSGTVTYSVAATTSTSARTGTLTIAGSTVTVTQAAVSRIISLSGALTFVPMQAGMTATKTLTVGNSGNSVLMVTGITYPAGFSGNWPGGPIAPGASRAVTVAFTPMAALAYTGTVTVEGNQTSGTDTTAVSGISTGFVLMQDSFTGSDGSLLTAHAADVKPVGAAWTVNGGSPVPALQNGMVGVAAGSGHLQATLDTRVSDIVMSVDYRAGTGPGMGALAFRLTDAENHLLLLTYLNQLQLYRRQKAAYTLLATAPLPGALVPDATHRLEVRATGTMIEGWWDGARILAIAEAFQQTATRHGIDFNSAFDATSKYDNLIASAAAAPAMPGVPGTPGPGTGAIDVGTATPLTWSETAATTSYDVKFGTTDPPLTTTNVATASWTPMLAAGTTYYWQVIARNTAGTTAGPVWSFTTAASEPGVVVQDSFTGASSTALVGHIPDVTPGGTGWVLNGGAPGPTLQNGAVGITPGTGHTPVTIETGVSNIRLTVDYKVGSGAGMGGVVLRLTDVNNFLVLLTYANELQLHKRQAGAWTLLARAPLPAALVGETTHRLEVRATGSFIEGWWDGVRKLQAIEPFQQTATRHGLDWNSAYDATSTYDNFVVSANGAGVPPTSGPIGPSPASR